jgi:hypothetical protein
MPPSVGYLTTGKQTEIKFLSDNVGGKGIGMQYLAYKKNMQTS